MSYFILGVLTTLLILFMFGRLKLGSGHVIERAINRRLSNGPYILAIGGGTGLSTLLRGIKAFTRNITAVVAVTDEGGSSGRLRNEWGMLPPGDVRNCIVALAENDNELKRILDFRFDRGELSGHSLGNLLLLAVTEMCGDFSKAVEQMNHLLSIRGRVLPVTTEGITLMGRTHEGLKVKGELEISEHGSSLKEIWLEPVNAKPIREVIDAVDDSDVILLGPGSLFTSVIPNLLLPDFAAKIRSSEVPKIYICNLMTQPEETQGMNVVQHLKWVSAALGCVPDFVIVNSDPIPDDIIEAYKLEGASPLYLDYHQREEIKNMGCLCVEAPTASVFESEKEGRVLRHDSQKLASVIFKVFRKINGE
ncbi:MAG: uridine diphosphate-N-acetylglucosamine-binding protein YvcK [Synergistaceae bacterium]|nr:uridine diphosphate-N-acetylglucosamine-binding protein YvcK [Synergistaceae bacterium]